MRISTRHFLLRFTLLAFLFGALVPFYAVYNPAQPSVTQEELASVFGEKLLICTGNGFEWVKLADLQQGKHAPHPDSHLKCGLCYMAAKGGMHHQLSPVVLALGIPLGHALRTHFSYDAPLAHGLSQRLASPRAPPAFV